MKKTLHWIAAAFALAAAHGAAAEDGVSADRIVLGQSVALSGPAAQLGIQMRNGLKAYFDEINAKGGVHGRRIELITLDDGYEPSRTVPNTRKLIDENILSSSATGSELISAGATYTSGRDNRRGGCRPHSIDPPRRGVLPGGF